MIQEIQEKDNWVSRGRLIKLIGRKEAIQKIKIKFYDSRMEKNEKQYNYVEKSASRVTRDTHGLEVGMHGKTSIKGAEDMMDKMEQTSANTFKSTEQQGDQQASDNGEDLASVASSIRGRGSTVPPATPPSKARSAASSASEGSKYKLLKD